MDAIRLVYRNPWNIVLALVAFAGMSVFFLWSSQVMVISGHGLSFLVEPLFVIAALAMALLFGLVLPLEIHAIRLAIASTTQTGGTALATLLGAASMTCCAPVLLPSILSLIGFSGTSILSVNETLNRFWLPLATVSIILLCYSLISVVSSLNLECRLERSGTYRSGSADHPR